MSFLLMQNLQVVIRNLTYNSISFNKSLIGETRDQPCTYNIRMKFK